MREGKSASPPTQEAIGAPPNISTGRSTRHSDMRSRVNDLAGGLRISFLEPREFVVVLIRALYSAAVWG